MLSNCHDYDFNIFELDSYAGKKTLMLLSYEVLERYMLFEEILNDKVFRNFINAISDGYNRSVVYHNDIHAADVLQTCFVMCDKANLVLVNINNTEIRSQSA